MWLNVKERHNHISSLEIWNQGIEEPGSFRIQPSNLLIVTQSWICSHVVKIDKQREIIKNIMH